MLKAEGKINEAIIESMLNWRHSGFNVYCGKAIWPHNEEGLENLAIHHSGVFFTGTDDLYTGL